MGYCNLLQKEAELVDSHIIPKSFFKDLRKDASHLILLGSELDFKKRSPIGIYDSNILSRDAEDILEKFDDYGVSFIRDGSEKKEVTDGKNVAYYWEAVNYNHSFLRKFFISVLWRASISKRSEFASVSLGQKYEERARKIILGQHYLNDSAFEILIQKYTPSEIENFEKSFLNPQRQKFEGRNSYTLYIGNLKVCIKVDAQPWPPFWEPFVMKEGRPLALFEKDFDQSQEKQLIIRMLNKYRK